MISPSVTKLRPVVSRKFDKTVRFSHSKFSISSTIIVAAETFQAALEFINAHLQQRDQVASKIRTVDFWLIVCGDTHVLTVATK